MTRRPVQQNQNGLRVQAPVRARGLAGTVSLPPLDKEQEVMQGTGRGQLPVSCGNSNSSRMERGSAAPGASELSPLTSFLVLCSVKSQNKKCRQVDFCRNILEFLQTQPEKQIQSYKTRFCWFKSSVWKSFTQKILSSASCFPRQHHSEGRQSSSSSDQLPSPQHALSKRQAAGKTLSILL